MREGRFKQPTHYFIGGIALILLLGFISQLRDPAFPFGALPDMNRYDSAVERKAAFYHYLRPIVEYHNQQIMRDRQRLLSVAGKHAATGEVTWWNRLWLTALARRYRLSPQNLTTTELLAQLQQRVDILPTSLVLTQAAKESGWGRSRFATGGNALFGQWCYRPGCGMVPQNRGAGAQHEVQRFPSVSAAVSSYMHNLNSDHRYQHLRSIRQQQRRQGRTPDGLALAEGLLHYSQRRAAYVDEVKKMIRQYLNFQ